MSKKSRRRNKILGALALGIGASKLGMLGGKTAAGIAGDKMATARKAMTSDVAMRGKTPIMPKAKPEITKAFPKKVGKDVISSGPFKMFGAGKKTVGGKKFSDESIAKFKAANEAAAERRAKLKMGNVDRPDVPGFFGMKFEKPLFKSGGSVMAKCKLGRNKKTKIY